MLLGLVVIGVIVYELVIGDIYVFYVKVVVIVIGGLGCMYKIMFNVYILIGDGIGIVFCKGFFLEDMEFYQFYFIGLVGLGILIFEVVCGEGGWLFNGEGECFMECYVLMIVDLVFCDIVVCLMVLEVLEGCGVGLFKDYVYIDVCYLGEEVFEVKLFDIIEFVCIYLGVDLVIELVLVYLMCYYLMGGILIIVIGQVLWDNISVVLGLYVVGECVCVLVYGVNWLGINLLLDINVFGCWVGIVVVSYVQGYDFVDMLFNLEVMVVGWVSDILFEYGNEWVVDICGVLQQLMDNNVVVFCIEEILKQVFIDIYVFKECYF